MKRRPSKAGERILMTGATGFVGANLLRRLLPLGFEVHLLLRKDPDTWRIQDSLSSVVVHSLDLREEKRVGKLIAKVSPQIVFHLAAETISSTSQSNDFKLVSTNLLGTMHLLSACRETPPSLFVNTGSSSEYGLKTRPMREDDLCQPVTTYGITKLAATLYGQIMSLSCGFPIITLRLFSPYGPYDDSERLIPRAIISALVHKDISLSKPNLVRDYIFVEDVIEAYLACISRKDGLAGAVLNIGSGRQRMIGSVVRMILRLTRSRSKIRLGSLTPPAYESPVWQADLRKTRRILGWKPRHSFISGMTKTIRWFKRHRQLYVPRDPLVLKD